MHRRWLRWRWIIPGLLLVALGYAAFSDNIHVWPVRNTLRYQLAHWWGPVDPALGHASIAGCLHTPEGAALDTAHIVASDISGHIYQARSDAQGCYTLADLPPGVVTPYITAPGYASRALTPWSGSYSLRDGATTRIDGVLERQSPSTPAPGTLLRIGAPALASAVNPQPSQALRRSISFSSLGQANQQTFVYTPEGSSRPLPVLLAVYPGQADEWESVSVPLSAAGYAVVAIGPAYSLDLERDVDELQQLIGLLRAGAIPGADGQQIALLAGSYSSLHVLRLLDEDIGFTGVVLLGPISDLFDLRERFEAGTFVPPYGLDQALIALGWPDRETKRYADYSAVYHVRPDWPPLLILHSSADEVVPPAQSHTLVGELEAAEVAVDAEFFSGMAHYLRTDENSPELEHMYQRTQAFLHAQMP